MNLQIEIDNLRQLSDKQRADIFEQAVRNVLSQAAQNGVLAEDEIENTIGETINFSLKAMSRTVMQST